MEYLVMTIELQYIRASVISGDIQKWNSTARNELDVSPSISVQMQCGLQAGRWTMETERDEHDRCAVSFHRMVVLEKIYFHIKYQDT